MRVLAVATDGMAGEHAGVTVFVCVDVEVDSECVIFLSMIITALKTHPPPPPRSGSLRRRARVGTGR